MAKAMMLGVAAGCAVVAIAVPIEWALTGQSFVAHPEEFVGVFVVADIVMGYAGLTAWGLDL